MPKIEIPSKIRVENFSEEDRSTASGIAAVYNQFVDQLYFLLNGALDDANINVQNVTFNVVTDGTGKIVNNPTVKFSLRNRTISGATCIKALCLNNIQQYPLSWPGMTYDVNNDTIIIKNITGLQANSQYSLTFRLFG